MSPRRAVNPGWKSYADLTFSPAVAAVGELLFVSGLNAIDESGQLQGSGDVLAQTRVIYAKLAAILETAGGSLSDVVRTTDYVLSREGYGATGAVRRELLGPVYPAATGVVVKELFGRGVLIEIDAIAVLSTSGETQAAVRDHRSGV